MGDCLRSQLADALDAALASFVDIVSDAETVGGADRRVPGMDWTVAEVAAHVTALHRRAIDDFRRSSTPEETAELNAVCLAEQPERDLSQLAPMLISEGRRAHDVLRGLPDDFEFPFHAGSRTTVVPASGVVLAEYLVHGDDIRRALGASDLPDPRHARLATMATLPLLPWWTLPGTPAHVVIRLAGFGDTISYEFDADTLHAHVDSVALPGASVVEVDPAQFLLAVPFGRRPVPFGCSALIERLAPI